MHRLGKDIDGESVAHSHLARFELIATGSTPRILGAVPNSDPSVLGALADCMAAPFHLLYVLHTSRGEGELGRYQSPEISRQQLDDFLIKFAPFLSQDGRFDLWLYSPAAAATVVWDRHDQLFAYGPVDCFARRLTGLTWISEIDFLACVRTERRCRCCWFDVSGGVRGVTSG